MRRLLNEKDGRAPLLDDSVTVYWHSDAPAAGAFVFALPLDLRPSKAYTGDAWRDVAPGEQRDRTGANAYREVTVPFTAAAGDHMTAIAFRGPFTKYRYREGWGTAAFEFALLTDTDRCSTTRRRCSRRRGACSRTRVGTRPCT